MFQIRLSIALCILSFLLVTGFLLGCGSSAKTAKITDEGKEESFSRTGASDSETKTTKDEEKPEKKGSIIAIKKDSAADTVRVFYKRLREKKFRDAIMLTNLRPAIEGLSDDELKDLGVDFGFLAQKVPENFPINGEIVTGNRATVTVKMPNEETGKPEVQEIKLRRENDNWVVLVADENGERMAKKEGKNYFFALRMDVHHKEAKAMLDRIGKAQMIHSMKDGGRFTDLKTLINKGYVPEDAKNAASTGYNYAVILAKDRTTYSATATPAIYGKTGRLSFALKITKEAQPELVSKDLKGKAVLN